VTMGVFRFKQFAVDDTGCGMKTGTDAVLLGAWAPLPHSGRVLDIGCGSGIISLMLAQRHPSLHITGVEIDAEAAAQAQTNVLQSPFASGVQVVHADVRTFAGEHPGQYHLVVSNPPFFQESLKSNDKKLNDARHDTSLNFTELAQSARKLLAPHGQFCLILPAESFPVFNERALLAGLYAEILVAVHHKSESAAVRMMACYRTDHTGKTRETSINIRRSDNSWSEEYLDLTRDFYLFA